ncbi:hypothetical protein V490_02946 [Pseudogymnoascus sp. VKM F-3557]|nr:hypothetical protein V490_02946 [Pseudogymnoascus sp. VKM F-3557]
MTLPRSTPPTLRLGQDDSSLGAVQAGEQRAYGLVWADSPALWAGDRRRRGEARRSLYTPRKAALGVSPILSHLLTRMEVQYAGIVYILPTIGFEADDRFNGRPYSKSDAVPAAGLAPLVWAGLGCRAPATNGWKADYSTAYYGNIPFAFHSFPLPSTATGQRGRPASRSQPPPSASADMDMDS